MSNGNNPGPLATNPLLKGFMTLPENRQKEMLTQATNNHYNDAQIEQMIGQELAKQRALPSAPVTIENPPQTAPHPMAHLISPELQAQMKQAFSLKPAQDEQKPTQQAQIQTSRNDKGGGGRFA